MKKIISISILAFAVFIRAYAQPFPVPTGGSATWTNVFNVKNYGAVGDGVTDDYKAITNAIYAASFSKGGFIYFPSGIYTSSATFFVPSGFTILGDGKGADADGVGNFTNVFNAPSRIVYNSSSNSLLVFSNVDYFSIRDICLENTNAAPNTNCSIILATSTNWNVNPIIQYVKFIGGGIQANMQVMEEGTIRGCIFLNPHWYALFSQNTNNPDAGDSFVDHNWFLERNWPCSASIFITSGGGLSIDHNKFNGVATNCILVIPDGATSLLNIDNNNFENFIGAAIHSTVGSSGILWPFWKISNNHFSMYNSPSDWPVELNSGVGNNSIISGNLAIAANSTAFAELGNMTNITIYGNLCISNNGNANLQQYDALGSSTNTIFTYGKLQVGTQ